MPISSDSRYKKKSFISDQTGFQLLKLRKKTLKHSGLTSDVLGLNHYSSTQFVFCKINKNSELCGPDDGYIAQEDELFDNKTKRSLLLF